MSEKCFGQAQFNYPNCQSGDQEAAPLAGYLFCDVCINALRNQATKDALTGLSNRYDLERSFNYLSESDNLLGAIHIDVSNVGLANKRLGHLAGDTLIKSAAESLRNNDTVSHMAARTGGDEFVVLIAKRIEPEEHEKIAADRRKIKDLTTEDGLEILEMLGNRIDSTFFENEEVATINKSSTKKKKHQIRRGSALYTAGMSLEELINHADSKGKTLEPRYTVKSILRALRRI